MPNRYRWHVDAAAADETDAAIVAEVLAGAVRDERNDPAEPVDVTFEQLAGDDAVTFELLGGGTVAVPPAPTPGALRRRVLQVRLQLAREASAGPLGGRQRLELRETIAGLEAELGALEVSP